MVAEEADEDAVAAQKEVVHPVLLILPLGYWVEKIQDAIDLPMRVMYMRR